MTYRFQHITKYGTKTLREKKYLRFEAIVMFESIKNQRIQITYWNN